MDSPAYRAGQELALQIERRTLEIMGEPTITSEQRNEWRNHWARDLTNELPLPLVIEPQAFVFGTEDATIDTGADSDSGAEPTGDDDNA